VGAELFHADRHEKANSLFSQFCESAWKEQSHVLINLMLFKFLYVTDYACFQNKKKDINIMYIIYKRSEFGVSMH
jgi:hypothetical protein